VSASEGFAGDTAEDWRCCIGASEEAHSIESGRVVKGDTPPFWVAARAAAAIVIPANKESRSNVNRTNSARGRHTTARKIPGTELQPRVNITSLLHSMSYP